VGDTAYVVDLVHHLRALTVPISYGYRSARLQEAQSDDIMFYVTRFLLPYLRKETHRPWTLEALDAKTSLKAIGNSLRTNKSVFIMHNLDDFLVSPSDIAFLRSVFGERATFYPLGGHLGNLWYPANRRAILALFDPLKRRGTFEVSCKEDRISCSPPSSPTTSLGNANRRRHDAYLVDGLPVPQDAQMERSATGPTGRR
jgi:hypothetical protein